MKDLIKQIAKKFSSNKYDTDQVVTTLERIIADDSLDSDELVLVVWDDVPSDAYTLEYIIKSLKENIDEIKDLFYYIAKDKKTFEILSKEEFYKEHNSKQSPHIGQLKENKNNNMTKKVNESTAEIVQDVNWAISAYMDPKDDNITTERFVDELIEAGDEYKDKHGEELILKFQSSGLEIGIYELTDIIESGDISQFNAEFKEIANGESQVVPASDMEENKNKLNMKKINENDIALIKFTNRIEKAITNYMNGKIDNEEAAAKIDIAYDDYWNNDEPTEIEDYKFRFSESGLTYSPDELSDAIRDGDRDILDELELIANGKQELEPILKKSSSKNIHRFDENGKFELKSFDEFVNEDRFEEIEDKMKEKGRGKSVADREKDKTSHMRDMSTLKNNEKMPNFDQHKEHAKDRSMNTSSVVNEADNKDNKDATTLFTEGFKKLQEEAKNYDQDEHSDHTMEGYMNEMSSLNAGMMAETFESTHNDTRNEELTNEQYEAACNEMKMSFDKKMNEMVEARASHGTIQEQSINESNNSWGLLNGTIFQKIDESLRIVNDALKMNNRIAGDIGNELVENLNYLKENIEKEGKLSNINECINFITEFKKIQKRNIKLSGRIEEDLGKALFDTLNSVYDNIIESNQIAKITSNLLENTSGYKKNKNSLKERKINSKFKKHVLPQLEQSEINSNSDIDKVKRYLTYANFVDELKRNNQVHIENGINEADSKVIESNTQKSINESNDDINLDQPFALIKTGGSIGSKNSYSVPATASMKQGGSIIKTGDDKEELKDEAKKKRKNLSKTDKKYYGMGYKVIELNDNLRKYIREGKEGNKQLDEIDLVSEWQSNVLPQIEEKNGKINKKKRENSFNELVNSKKEEGIISEEVANNAKLPNKFLKESNIRKEIEKVDLDDAFLVRKTDDYALIQSDKDDFYVVVKEPWSGGKEMPQALKTFDKLVSRNFELNNELGHLSPDNVVMFGSIDTFNKSVEKANKFKDLESEYTFAGSDVMDGLRENKEIKSKKSINEKLDAQEAVEQWKDIRLPDIKKEEDGEPDPIMRREDFNNFIDSLSQDDELEDDVDPDKLELPDELEEA